MHFYRICLVLFHICSTLTYIPHLLNHIKRLPLAEVSPRSKIAYITYWIGYCVLVFGVLIWCLIIICRKQTIWQLIRVTAHLLIAKLIYTSFDLIVRILLNYTYAVVIFDIIHIILLVPAIALTFVLIEHVKKEKNSSTLIHDEHNRNIL
ncbi:unnamed protein product [Adineta steineri]|uniref:Uncharacterized protein n=1 Tax=Adineta steineri TaxID=433720 RepID=A0A814EUQ4_9BILA|nr:unnamed protein product [Adineta steineri]CAF1301450.1 unnamed protein product [Adineta steineri]CAF1377803.1 unnamed protein product [Adineta steineri]